MRSMIAFATLACLANLALGQDCGPLTNAYGPFDYRTSSQQLQIVEGTHFTPGIESLTRAGTGPFGGDLDYTLRASPNHHRALMAMINLAQKTRADPPQGSRYTIACWLNRAIRFAGDDGVVRMINGIYLYRFGKKQDALAQFKEAERLQSDNANVDYNLGLIYFDMKDYDKALHYAQRAYQLGFRLPGLRDKLLSAGKWHEPATTAESATRRDSEPESKAK